MERFQDWYKREGHTVATLSSQKVANFLVFLLQDCHSSSTTIKGYKAMLNSVFAFKGFDLSFDTVLRR